MLENKSQALKPTWGTQALSRAINSVKGLQIICAASASCNRFYSCHTLMHSQLEEVVHDQPPLPAHA